MRWTAHTPDGRALAVEDFGDPAGFPVLVQVGTPSSRRLPGCCVTDAAARGLRLISYDRPGYGDSSPHPGYRVADSAADVQAICAELGISRLAVWGLSGGGAHALACAALLPGGMVTAVASLAGLAPWDAAGLDWLAGFSADALHEVDLMFNDPAACRTMYAQSRDRILAGDPRELAAGLLTPGGADLDVLTAEVNSMKLAWKQGIEGAWDDGFTQCKPWGFDLAQLRVPVLLLHGRDDPAVPFSHGEWLAAHIPGAEAWFFSGEGHSGLLERHIGEVHAWLAGHSGAGDARGTGAGDAR